MELKQQRNKPTTDDQYYCVITKSVNVKRTTYANTLYILPRNNHNVVIRILGER